jgi:hypothetical protein
MVPVEWYRQPQLTNTLCAKPGVRTSFLRTTPAHRVSLAVANYMRTTLITCVSLAVADICAQHSSTASHRQLHIYMRTTLVNHVYLAVANTCAQHCVCVSPAVTVDEHIVYEARGADQF